MKYNFENGVLKDRANAGESGVAGHCEMSLRVADTGHKGEVDWARNMSTFVAMAVFDEGRDTVRPDAVNLRCLRARWSLGETAGSHDSQVNSPDRKKAAKLTQMAV